MRQAGEDPLILDSGDLFFSTSSINDNNVASERYRAGSILKGYEKIGCDAINVGRYELLSGLAFLKEKERSTSIPFISANLRDGKTGERLFEPYRIVQQGTLTVGVIGLTSMFQDTLGAVITDDYVETGRSYLRKLKRKVDIAVILINTERKNYDSLPDEFPEADLIFVSGSTMLTRLNMPQKKGGPYVYSSGKQGKQLTVVDMNMKNDRDPVVNVSYQQAMINYIRRRFEKLQEQDPNRQLAEIYAEDDKILHLIRNYRQELEKMEMILENAVNILEFQNIPMGDTINDDPEMLSFVDRSLETCGSLKIKPVDEQAARPNISDGP